MNIPLSWLKEYVDITLPTEELAERLSESGTGVEKILEERGDKVFEFEITPNRPDCLSVIGVAREVAAIENKPIKFPKVSIDVTKIKPKIIKPLNIKTDSKINPRFTGIIIDNITVKESPQWLREKLESVGQRSINNIVDITNFVMLELGNPMHAFDYDKISGQEMTVHLTRGGESFKSVDSIPYTLPKDTVVISDSEKIIDLCGIKGGYNSGTFPETKTIFIRVPVEDKHLIRMTSLNLGLRSEASNIFEKGVNAGGTIEALNRCVSLILEYAGGEIVSKLYDIKHESFASHKVSVRPSRVTQILGITIEATDILDLLSRLELSPKNTKPDTIECTIPTYRQDIHQEIDLIEEIGRLYGYNNFPKTLPLGSIPVEKIPFSHDYKQMDDVKQYLLACGFSEIYSYSLINEKDLTEYGYDPEKTIKANNPVSREYAYLRPSLKASLMRSIKQNKALKRDLHVFELGRVYLGDSLDKTEEVYNLSGISTKKSFWEIKGMLEKLFTIYNCDENPALYMEICAEGIYFEVPYSLLLENAHITKLFKALPKYPPIIEDLAFIVRKHIPVGDIIAEIKKQSPLIAEVSLLDVYEDTKTFHIIYLDSEKNLTTDEVTKIRTAIIHSVENTLGIKAK